MSKSDSTTDVPTPLPLVQLSSLGYQPGSFDGCEALRLVLRPPLVRVIHVSGPLGAGKTTLGEDITDLNPESICVADTDRITPHHDVLQKIIYEKHASKGPTPELDAAYARMWSLSVHESL